VIEGATGAPLRVLYDDQCGLCRRLAEYGRTRSEDRLDFIPWSDFAQTQESAQYFTQEERSAPPARLRTLHDGGVREDQEAWAAILATYPPFEKFSWIVERLGLMGAVSQATYHGAQWLRNRCGGCP
jgi:predicted DCC family thiol-disulfide oxidoreductase YuxK